jgi:predicted amidohydrolase
VLACGSLQRASALPPELELHPGRMTSPDQWVLRGGSAIIAPDGSYLQGPVFDEPRILTAELELSRVREESMSLDVAGHYHRPDCLELVITRRRR